MRADQASSDPFGVLGVAVDVSEAELTRAYRACAKRFHPDAGGPDASAAAFAGVRDAYERIRVLRGFAAGPALPLSPPPTSPTPSSPAGFSPPPPPEAPRHLWEPAPPGTPARTEGRVVVSVTVTVAEVIAGTQVTVVAPSALPCPECAGGGLVRAEAWEPGDTKYCAACAGHGVQATFVRAAVVVPAGVSDGEELVFPGRGAYAPPATAVLHAGPASSARGDLVVKVAVDPDSRFRVRGQDLWHDVVVGFTTAALGGVRALVCPDGPLELTIPAGTQPGQLFRFPGRGVPRRAFDAANLEVSRGDLVVEVVVEIPRTLSDAQRALLEEFAATR